jgi:MFS family permease
VTAVATSAWPLFGLHAGWLVDRVSRRAMLIWMNLGRAAVLVVVTGLYAPWRSPPAPAPCCTR